MGSRDRKTKDLLKAPKKLEKAVIIISIALMLIAFGVEAGIYQLPIFLHNYTGNYDIYQTLVSVQASMVGIVLMNMDMNLWCYLKKQKSIRHLPQRQFGIFIL